jgi:hypothetical protein
LVNIHAGRRSSLLSEAPAHGKAENEVARSSGSGSEVCQFFCVNGQVSFLGWGAGHGCSASPIRSWPHKATGSSAIQTVWRRDGVTRDYDVVIDGGKIRKRKKKPSKQFRDEFGHTPLSIEEEILWKCRRLVVGTGTYGRLPVMRDCRDASHRRAAAGCGCHGRACAF